MICLEQKGLIELLTYIQVTALSSEILQWQYELSSFHKQTELDPAN